MASTPIKFSAETGATITVDLTQLDDTSVATGLSATEETNGKGLYVVTYTGATTGLMFLTVKKSGTVSYVWAVNVVADDTTTYIAFDYALAGIFDWNGTAVSLNGGLPAVDAKSISASETAANNLESCFTGTITTLDALDSAQDTQHGTTQTAVVANAAAIAALNDLSSADVLAALEDGGLVLQTGTIATLASQTSFTLSAGSADDDAYNDATIVIEDATTATQKCKATISDYTGSTKTITLSADPGVFTMAAGDKFRIVTGGGGGGATVDNDAIADAVLKRAVSNVEDTADRHSLGALIMIGTNSALSNGQLVAKKPTDDSTFESYVIASMSNASVVTGVS